MGYYTEFTLRAKSNPVIVEEVVTAYDLPLAKDGTFYEPVKWYEHEDDMRSISRLHPDVVFALRGHGENFGDDWIKYFKGGKSYKHELKEELFVYYDERRLT